MALPFLQGFPSSLEDMQRKNLALLPAGITPVLTFLPSQEEKLPTVTFSTPVLSVETRSLYSPLHEFLKTFIFTFFLFKLESYALGKTSLKLNWKKS